MSIVTIVVVDISSIKVIKREEAATIAFNKPKECMKFMQTLLALLIKEIKIKSQILILSKYKSF